MTNLLGTYHHDSVDPAAIAERMARLMQGGETFARAYEMATREEAARTEADIGGVREIMLHYIQQHAVFTADGGWSVKTSKGEIHSL